MCVPTDLVVAEHHAERYLADLRPVAIGVDEIVISETMRLGELGDPIIGIYERENRRIVIRRDQLANPVDYCGTLLHELTHAASGATDGSMDFEAALSRQLGVIVTNVLHDQR